MKENILIPAGTASIDVETIVKINAGTPNLPPIVDPGPNLIITLPVNSVQLVGSASDPEGSLMTYLWKKLSGGAATITDPAKPITDVTGLVAGAYVFELTVTDNKGAGMTKTKTVTVLPAVVIPPPTPGVVKYLTLPKGAPQSHIGKSNIVIENLQFTNPSGNIIYLESCANVIIRNCYFGPSSGEAISIYKGASITIEKCLFVRNRTGVYAVQTTGNIKVINCQFVNVKGPMPRGQYVQFNTITGPGNLIENNKGESWWTLTQPESYPADLINIFNSQGTPDSWITIRGNILRGGGPMPSGGGIMAGDIGGRYTLVENNKLVNPGQYGYGIAGGDHISIINNQLYADRQSFNNIGYYAWAQAGAACGINIIFDKNRSHYVNRDGILNNWWAAPNCPAKGTPPTDITLAEMNLPAHLIDFVSPSELLTIRK